MPPVNTHMTIVYEPRAFVNNEYITLTSEQHFYKAKQENHTYTL
jgi:hypothetical protein